MSAQRLDGVLLFILATLLLGYTLQVNNGVYAPETLAGLLVSVFAAALALTASAWWPSAWGFSNWSARGAGLEVQQGGHREGLLIAVMVIGLALNLALLATMWPGLYLEKREPAEHPFFLACLAGAALSLAAMVLDRRRALRVWFPIVLAIAAALGLWMLDASPRPKIDVITVHKYAIAALRSGENPYAITFPDIYGDAKYYAEGMTRGGQVLFGFPYPPLSLFMALPGQVFFKDIRVAELVALLSGAALLGYAPRDRTSIVAPLSAALLLFTPRSLFVLEQGWTESFAVMWLCATVFAACRAPRALPWTLAALVSVKQHMVLAVPLALLLLPRPLQLRSAVKLLAPAFIAPVLLALPFAAWDSSSFLDSVVWLQFKEPFRPDALSVLSGLHAAGWTIERNSVVTLGLPLLALAIGLFASWRWSPRTAAGFTASLGFTLLLVFATSKKAFCNYYYFVIATFCAAIAVYADTSARADTVRGSDLGTDLRDWSPDTGKCQGRNAERPVVVSDSLDLPPHHAISICLAPLTCRTSSDHSLLENSAGRHD